MKRCDRRENWRDISMATALAAVSAVLYASILPLWEGFDEPFHYACIQSLADLHSIPVFGKTYVSQEVRESFRDTPLSRLLSSTQPGSISFEEWFRLDVSQRKARRAPLQVMQPSLRNQRSELLNYEAQQAPLAYFLCVPVYILSGALPIEKRVLLLRIFSSLISAALLITGLIKVTEVMKLNVAHTLILWTCVLESQMLWASVDHVGNDWLAIPLTLLFLVWLGVVASTNRPKNVVLLSVFLALGLLTKAYFLALVPVYAALLISQVRRRTITWKLAGACTLIIAAVDSPWYVRNLRLYSSLAGTQQGVEGIGIRQALEAVPQINWFKSFWAFAHWSVWTGNWSFVSFSTVVVAIELLLLGLGVACFLVTLRPFKAPVLWTAGGLVCFLIGLVYQTCVTWVHTKGLSTFAEPWYWQGAVPVVWAFALAGCQRWKLTGRIAIAVLCGVASWIAVVTYAGKLLPVYGGGIMRSNVSGVWRWWTTTALADLSLILPAPFVVVSALLVLHAALVICLLLTNAGRLLATTARPLGYDGCSVDC